MRSISQLPADICAPADIFRKCSLNRAPSVSWRTFWESEKGATAPAITPFAYSAAQSSWSLHPLVTQHSVFSIRTFLENTFLVTLTYHSIARFRRTPWHSFVQCLWLKIAWKSPMFHGFFKYNGLVNLNEEKVGISMCWRIRYQANHSDIIFAVHLFFLNHLKCLKGLQRFSELLRSRLKFVYIFLICLKYFSFLRELLAITLHNIPDISCPISKFLTSMFFGKQK